MHFEPRGYPFFMANNDFYHFVGITAFIKYIILVSIVSQKTGQTPKKTIAITEPFELTPLKSGADSILSIFGHQLRCFIYCHENDLHQSGGLLFLMVVP